jgi:hypothetical protein
MLPKPCGDGTLYNKDSLDLAGEIIIDSLPLLGIHGHRVRSAYTSLLALGGHLAEVESINELDTASLQRVTADFIIMCIGDLVLPDGNAQEQWLDLITELSGRSDAQTNPN